MCRIISILAIFCGTALGVFAQIQFDAGSDGSDGAFVMPANQTTVIDLNLYPDGVINATTFTMQTNAVLQFQPNSDNTPIVILCQGHFIMAQGAKLEIQGKNGTVGAGGVGGKGGPGGWDGGNGGVAGTPVVDPGVGLGPGGGGKNLSGLGSGVIGGANNELMRPSLIPLIGGSGGGGGFAGGNSGAGGGGGGALLIACNGRFEMSNVSGTYINASGGDGGNLSFYGSGGGGSGGAVRIIAAEIIGGYSIDCSGGFGGTGGQSATDGSNGIIRLESFRMTRNFNFASGVVYTSLPGLVDSDATDLSTLRIASIGGAAVPTGAGANPAMPDIIVPAGVSNPVEIVVEATNVTPGATAMIRVHLGGPSGAIQEFETGPLTGTPALSTATANVDLQSGVGTMAAVLRMPVMPRPSGGKSASVLDKMRLEIGGEPVEVIEQVFVPGSARKMVAYRTYSGRELSYIVP